MRSLVRLHREGRAGGDSALRHDPERVYGALSPVWAKAPQGPECVSGWGQWEGAWVSLVCAVPCGGTGSACPGGMGCGCLRTSCRWDFHEPMVILQNEHSAVLNPHLSSVLCSKTKH